MYVKPATSEVKVRDPHNKRHIPAEGCDVPETAYWRRRLRDGDVVPAKPERPARQPKAAKAEE